MHDVIVGIDLGGTNIKAGVVSREGTVLHRLSVATPAAPAGPQAIATATCDAARRAMRACGEPASRVGGIGVGSPGTIDRESGVVGFSPNIPCLTGFSLRRAIEDELGLPAVLENDANAAALAEQWIGVGRGFDSLVLFTLGTGIGGGIVVDGHVLHGSNGAAGEIGHMCIAHDGPRCACGNRGCLEVFASAPAMVRRMREAIAGGVETSLRQRAGDLTARDIHEAALAGDAAAIENVEATGRYLGVGVSNILHVLNPRVVAFSGGVTAAGDMLLDPVKAEVARRTLEFCRRDVRIGYSEIPADTGIIGAARCFMQS